MCLVPVSLVICNHETQIPQTAKLGYRLGIERDLGGRVSSSGHLPECIGHLLYHLWMGVRQIDAFRWILDQVVQLGTRRLDVLPLGTPETSELAPAVAYAGEEGLGVGIDLLPLGRIIIREGSVQERRQTSPVKARGKWYLQKIEDGGQDIGGLHRLLYLNPREYSILHSIGLQIGFSHFFNINS